MTRATIEVPLHEASTLRVLVSYAKVSAASDQKFWAEQAEKSSRASADLGSMTTSPWPSGPTTCSSCWRGNEAL